jgi:radical SAM protein with 4Fe4S-binding SPASM domain
MRLRQGVPDLHLQVQFVIQEKNHQEAGDFLKYWRDAWACYGQGSGHFEVMFKRLSVSGGAKGQAAADSLYERTLQEAKIESVEKPGFSVKTWEQRPWQQDDGHQGARKACPGLWYTPVVRQDGMLLMCCADLQSELALGKLGEHGFKELWNGEKARKKREEHLKGIFTGVCASCGGINWMPAPEH